MGLFGEKKDTDKRNVDLKLAVVAGVAIALSSCSQVKTAIDEGITHKSDQNTSEGCESYVGNTEAWQLKVNGKIVGQGEVYEKSSDQCCNEALPLAVKNGDVILKDNEGTTENPVQAICKTSRKN